MWTAPKGFPTLHRSSACQSPPGVSRRMQRWWRRFAPALRLWSDQTVHLFDPWKLFRGGDIFNKLLVVAYAEVREHLGTQFEICLVPKHSKQKTSVLVCINWMIKCTRFVLTSSGLKLAGRLAELYLHINKVEKRWELNKNIDIVRFLYLVTALSLWWLLIQSFSLRSTLAITERW